MTTWAVGDKVTAAKLNLIEAAITDSGWTTLTLGNSWISYDAGATYGIPAYRKYHGIVILAGEMKSGTTGTAIFTMPVGYRPLKNQIYTVSSANGNATLTLDSGGIMSLTLYNGGSNASVSLNGISYIAEQ